MREHRETSLGTNFCTDLVALACRGGAIQALMLEAAQAHVVADDVQHAHHLAEYQHPAALVALLSHTSFSFEAQAMHAPSLAAHSQQEQFPSKMAASSSCPRQHVASACKLLDGVNYSSISLESVMIHCSDALRGNQPIILAIRMRDCASCSKVEAESPVACFLKQANQPII